MITKEKIRVPFADTDALGVVYYANYLRYFERVGAEWFRKFDKPFTEYMAQGLYFIVTETHVRYIKPARYDEVLIAECSLGALDKFKFRLDYKILNESDEILVEGYNWHVMVDKTRKIKRLPKEFFERFKDAKKSEGKNG